MAKLDEKHLLTRAECATEKYHLFRSTRNRYAVIRMEGWGNTAAVDCFDEHREVRVNHLLFFVPVTCGLSKEQAVTALAMIRRGEVIPEQWRA